MGKFMICYYPKNEDIEYVDMIKKKYGHTSYNNTLNHIITEHRMFSSAGFNFEQLSNLFRELIQNRK